MELFRVNHLVKSSASALMFLIWATFPDCIELLLSNYLESALFLLARDFCRFSSLSLVMYSNRGVNFPWQAITAFCNSAGRSC